MPLGRQRLLSVRPSTLEDMRQATCGFMRSSLGVTDRKELANLWRDVEDVDAWHRWRAGQFRYPCHVTPPMIELAIAHYGSVVAGPCVRLRRADFFRGNFQDEFSGPASAAPIPDHGLDGLTADGAVRPRKCAGHDVDGATGL